MDVVAAAGLLKDGIARRPAAQPARGRRCRAIGRGRFKSVREIADPAFKRIAIGDPAAVPAGVYAKQYLEKEGLWAAVQARIVPTGSVRAALAAVESGAADAGDRLSNRRPRRAASATVAWVVPADRGPRIVYPAAIVRDDERIRGGGRALPRLPPRRRRRSASSSASGSRVSGRPARWRSGGSPGSPWLCAAGATAADPARRRGRSPGCWRGASFPGACWSRRSCRCRW